MVETKGTTDIHQLRPDEQMKILSAKRRFEVVRDVRFIGPTPNFSVLYRGGDYKTIPFERVVVRNASSLRSA